MVAFTLALVAISYLDRICISTAAPAMKADLSLTDTQMGWVFSFFVSIRRSARALRIFCRVSRRPNLRDLRLACRLLWGGD